MAQGTWPPLAASAELVKAGTHCIRYGGDHESGSSAARQLRMDGTKKTSDVWTGQKGQKIGAAGDRWNVPKGQSG
jgi:hypothetical protein